MSKKLGDITAIIKDYLNDTTITVDQHAIDSINHLSSLFPLKKIDSSQTTTAGQDYLVMPSGCIRVNSIFINKEEVPNLESLDDLQNALDYGAQRFYVADGKIMFVQKFSESGQGAVIYYNGSYLLPTVSVSTDVPDEMMELVYIGGVFRYFRKMVSIVATSREKYPDVTPEEIGKIRDTWRDEYYELIEDIQTK